MITHYIVEKKLFCCYCFQAFRAAEALKCHMKNSFKINGKQRIKMPTKGEHFRFKNYERKIKPPFVIYADFESILVPGDNEKQNPNESNESKYYNNSNKLVVDKMKDETGGVAIKELVGLKSKMYSFMVDDSSDHKKVKGVNKYVVAKISLGQYKMFC